MLSGNSLLIEGAGDVDGDRGELAEKGGKCTERQLGQPAVRDCPYSSDAGKAEESAGLSKELIGLNVPHEDGASGPIVLVHGQSTTIAEKEGGTKGTLLALLEHHRFFVHVAWVEEGGQ